MKFKYFLLVPVLGLFAFGTTHLPQSDPKKEQVMIEATLASLAQLHYEPLALDDRFSERVYDLYIDRMDATKRFYLQSDIDQLAAYKGDLDDQSKDASFAFFDLSVKLWEQRLDFIKGIYEEILTTPMTFDGRGRYEADPDKRSYARNEAELRTAWEQSLTYQVMSRVEEMLNDQEDKDPSEQLTVQQLEEKARAKVLKSHQDWFHRLERMDRERHLSGYLNAITSAFDPHTNYYAPKDKEDFDINMSGRLEGIGARLMEEGIHIKVSEIVPGSPSWKQGELQAGDLILAVAQEGDEEATSVVDMPIDDAVQLIRGKKGTEVRLTVKKADGSRKVIPIIRDVVVTEEGYAKSSILTDEDYPGLRIGMIHLPKFYTDFTGTGGRTCSEDVKQEVLKLKSEGVDGIMIDLRYNGGGSLRDVVDMSGLFIDKGPIVQVKSRDRKPYILEDEAPGSIYDGPLVILVNEYSASASEIMAAALQDYGRAVIIGSEHTFGKGTVQRFLDLDRIVTDRSVKPLGSVKMTIQKFYRINGTTTQLIGVSSDIVLPDNNQFLQIGEEEEDYPLAWDEITPAKYKKVDMVNVELLAKLRTASQKRVANNPTFQLINESAAFLKERREETQYPLNLNKFRKQQQALDEKSKQYNNITQVIDGLHIAACQADQSEYDSNEKFKTRLDKWHETVVKDVQVDEAIAVLNDWINYQALSKN